MRNRSPESSSALPESELYTEYNNEELLFVNDEESGNDEDGSGLVLPLETLPPETPAPCPAQSATYISPIQKTVVEEAFAIVSFQGPIIGLSSTSYQAFLEAQTANQPRLPWNWNSWEKSKALYTSAVAEKWWSISQEELAQLKSDKRSDRGHIGCIMETELGKQFCGEARCTACSARGMECWIYSKKGSQQVAFPGDSCVRCRWASYERGYSLSKRKKCMKITEPPTRPYRQLLPKKGGPPFSGAGGASGISV